MINLGVPFMVDTGRIKGMLHRDHVDIFCPFEYLKIHFNFEHCFSQNFFWNLFVFNYTINFDIFFKLPILLYLLSENQIYVFMNLF